MIAGFTYYQLLQFFVIYSFAGWCVEVIYQAAAKGIVVNRGFLNGPVCPIYGFGVLAVFALFHLSPERTMYDANALMAQTLQDCEAHKKQARDWALGISQGSYNFVSDALGKYQNIAMNNLNEISEIYKQLQGGYESHMQSLQANPKVQAAQQPTAVPDAQDEE